MYEDQWRKSILLFLILFIHIILSSVNSWHSHCEERTTEICPRMLEPQMTPWSLWHQGRRSRTPATPPTSLVQRPPQMMLWWALLYTVRPFTGSLREQHLNGQGAAHSKAPRVRPYTLDRSVYHLALRKLPIRSWWMHTWFSILLKHIISVPFNFHSTPPLELPHKVSVLQENFEIPEIFSMSQFYAKLLKNILPFPRLSDFHVSEWTMEITVT